MYLIAIVLIAALVYGPQYWIRYVMAKYSDQRDDIPGTGGELARHLIERFKLEGVEVEPTALGDHYDPQAKMVRLTSAHYEGRSLTAVAVAAHEVGHAIQYHRKEKITLLRQRFSPLAMIIGKLAVGALIAVPIVAAVLKIPQVALLTAGLGVVGMLMSVLIQFIILPLEWDASFNKALPILTRGDYIKANDEPAVRSVLKAAAFTYVAGALSDILRLGRWLAILRGAIR